MHGDYLPEPDDVWPPYLAADDAPRRQLLKRRLVALLNVPAFRTPYLPYIAVHLDYVPAARHLMEAVNVLRDKGELLHLTLELGKGEVPRVGLCVLYGAPSPVVPFPYEPGVIPEGLRCREILRSKIPPESVLAPESRNTAFGGDTRARKNGER